MDVPQTQFYWLIKIAAGIFILILAAVIFKWLVRFVDRKWQRLGQWRARLDKIFFLPVHCILWIVGITYAIQIISLHFGFPLAMEYVRPARNVGLICCVAWLLIRWKDEVQIAFLAKSRHLDTGVIKVIGRILTIVILLLGMLIAIQMLGFNIVPLVTFGGIGAAAMGFAAKDTIANFFGGCMLYLNHPFVVGEYISLPERNIEGYVEEIGWFLTSLRDKEKRAVYIPNESFSTIFIVNHSRMTHRRIEEKIGIRYADFPKMREILSDLKTEIESHPDVDKNEPVLIYFDAFEDYALNIYIDFYCTETNWANFVTLKEAILLRIYEILEKHQAQMPYPTTSIEFNT